MRSAVFIADQRSRHVQQRYQTACKLLEARGIRLEATLARDGDDVERRVAAAVAAEVATIIVGGGDGAMTRAVRPLAHAASILGVLPLGTGNSFAQSVGVPLDLAGAVEVIAHGHWQQVDLGVVNDTYFANFATIGFPADVARRAPRWLKRFAGAAAYAIGSLGSLPGARAFRCTIRSKDGKEKLRTHQIIVASGRYFGATPVTPQAAIDDGRFALFAPAEAHRWSLLLTYAAMALRAHTRLPGCLTLSQKELRIRTRPPQRINVDGDDLGKTPARFAIARDALRVYMPAPPQAPTA